MAVAVATMGSPGPFLHDALGRLLETKDFEAISVRDIADAATLDRPTFYDHYPDKSALPKCLVAVRFKHLLGARGVRFDGTCGSALGAIALGVCDYSAKLPKQDGGPHRALGPHLETAVNWWWSVDAVVSFMVVYLRTWLASG